MGGPGDPKIDTFRAHFVTLSPGPLWGSKWSQNGLKMEPKWEQNGAQIEQNGDKLEIKCIKKVSNTNSICLSFFIFICLVFVG